MNSQTSLVARQVRLNEWAAQVRDCQNRPQGWLLVFHVLSFVHY